MLHCITSLKEYYLYLRDSVSERMNIFYMSPYKSIVIRTLEIKFSACIKPIDICYTCYK